MAYNNIRFSKPNMVVVDNNFFMFDHVNDKLVQKSDDGKTVFEYPLNIILSEFYIEDNFEELNTDKWDFSGSVYSIVPTGLRLSANANTPGLFSNEYNDNTIFGSWWLTGDFDLRLFFNIVSYDNGPAYWDAPCLRIHGVSFGTASTKMIQIARRCNGVDNHDYQSWHYDGSVWTDIGSIATIPSDAYFSEGGLRIYRSGSTVYNQYYSGTAWTALSNTTLHISNNDVRIRAYASSWSGNPNVVVDLKRIESKITLGEVLSSQYDGTYFWTLQLLGSNKGVLIRKWLVDDYECKLKEEFIYRNTNVNTYYSRAFGIEHYLTEFSSNFSSGSNVISIDEYYDSVVTSGTVLSLGPNSSGEREDVTADLVVAGQIILSGNLNYSYSEGNQVGINKSLFIFNDYVGTSSSEGSLIRINSIDGNYVSSTRDIDYKSVYASTFSRFQNVLLDYPDAHSLVYVKNTNAKLINMSSFSDRYDAYTVNDDFTGADGSLPDTIKWSIVNGDPRIYNNALFCSTVINGTDEIMSKYEIINDFDVVVSGTVGDHADYSYGYNTFNYKHYIKFSFPYNGDYTAEFGFYYENNEMPVVPSSGLIREYTFESYLGTTLYDTSGIGSNAAMSSIGIVPGLVSNAGQIDSKTDYILLSSAVAGSIVSISLSYYYNGNGGNWNTLVCRNGGSYHHIIIDTSGYIGFYNVGFYSSGFQLTVGNWYHIVLIKNGTNSKLYINKTLLQNSNSSFNNNSYPIGVIGNQASSSPSQGALGNLDQIRIYNRELTTDEISDLYGEAYYSHITDNYKFYTAINGSLDSSSIFPVVDRNYFLRTTRSGYTLNFYYKTSVSGVFDSNWTLFDSLNTYQSECSLSLGLYSSGVTVSGSYFDDLTYDYGYIRYPLASIPYYGVMNMDNIRSNGSTVIPVYNISIVGDSMYRLQDEATYYGVDNDWGSQYNYQVSPIRPFIDFITVGAYPEILPATGRNISQITAVVLDQYGEGAIGKPVHFTDDDPIGFITLPDRETDYFHGTGVAKTNYMSGTSLRIATVVGTATQYD